MIEFVLLGDCRLTGKIVNAVRAGYNATMNIYLPSNKLRESLTKNVHRPRAIRQQIKGAIVEYLKITKPDAVFGEVLGSLL